MDSLVVKIFCNAHLTNEFNFYDRHKTSNTPNTTHTEQIILNKQRPQTREIEQAKLLLVSIKPSL